MINSLLPPPLFSTSPSQAGLSTFPLHTFPPPSIALRDKLPHIFSISNDQHPFHLPWTLHPPFFASSLRSTTSLSLSHPLHTPFPFHSLSPSTPPPHHPPPPKQHLSHLPCSLSFRAPPSLQHLLRSPIPLAFPLPLQPSLPSTSPALLSSLPCTCAPVLLSPTCGSGL